MPEYYKLTREKELHHGLQINDGLVVDPKPWDPSEYSLNGIHMCEKKDIKQWTNIYNDITWIRRVEIPPDAQLMRFRYRSKADKVIFGARVHLSEMFTDEELVNLGLFRLVQCQTPALTIKALWKNGFNAKYVKDNSPDFWKISVSSEGENLAFVPEEFRTRDVCLAAVRNRGSALSYVPKQTEEICLEAVKQDPLALQYIQLVENQTEKVCIEAVRGDHRALFYMSSPSRKVHEIFHTSRTKHVN